MLTKDIQKNSTVLGKFDLDEILPLLGSDIDDKKTIQFNGHKVKTNTPRLRCLKHSQTCVSCGKKGAFFLLEWHTGHGSPHFNMYSDDGSLMTYDHIIPKSKYKQVKGPKPGLESEANTQTMCRQCNMAKSDKYDGE